MKMIITAILGFGATLITALTTPIQSMVLFFLPESETAFVYVANFFVWLADFITWVLSWLPFTEGFWLFFVSYLIFKLTVPLAVHSVKVVVKWWHYIVP